MQSRWWLKVACFLTAGLSSGVALSQQTLSQDCSCFRLGEAGVQATFTEYRATNECPSRVEFLWKARQFGGGLLFEKGETKTWRCTGGTDVCGKLSWQRVASCPVAGKEPSQPRR